MPRKKQEKDLCTEHISFRCTKNEKRTIKKSAEKNNLQQKEFIMKCIYDSCKKEQTVTQRMANQAICACEVQALVNHLKRNYKEDSYIKEVCKRLWNLVK